MPNPIYLFTLLLTVGRLGVWMTWQVSPVFKPCPLYKEALAA